MVPLFRFANGGGPNLALELLRSSVKNFGCQLAAGPGGGPAVETPLPGSVSHASVHGQPFSKATLVSTGRAEINVFLFTENDFQSE